jgi:hypothetical protein
MSKSKMHKHELGTHRPTEEAALKSEVQYSKTAWLNRIYLAQNESSNEQITAVFVELFRSIRAKQTDAEVAYEIAKMDRWNLSIREAQQRILR